MSLYVLDTDHVTLFQRSHPLVATRVAAARFEDLAITIVTAEEQLRGWLKLVRRSSAGNNLILAYSGLRRALDYFCRVRLLDFDEAAHSRFEALRRSGLRIGTRDLRISAIVLSTGGVLVTRNRRDFSLIPHLAIEDWTVAPT